VENTFLNTKYILAKILQDLARSSQDHENLERKPNLDRPICNLDYTLFTKFFHIWVKTNNYQIVYKNVVYFNIN